MLCAMEVFTVDKRYEFGIGEILGPSKPIELFERIPQIHAVEIQLLLGLPDVELRGFRARAEKLLLISEMMKDLSLVRQGSPGDFVNKGIRCIKNSDYAANSMRALDGFAYGFAGFCLARPPFGCDAKSFRSWLFAFNKIPDRSLHLAR